MIGDGFYPIRDHLKAIVDSFRRQARGVVPALQPLHSHSPPRRVAAADQRDAAMLDHDLHAGADREPMLFEPPSRHSQVRHDSLGEGASHNAARGEREDIRRPRRPRLWFSTRGGRPSDRFPHAAKSRPAERGQTVDGFGQS
jgi:hypothetical protein